MFDGVLRGVIDRPLNCIGRVLVSWGWKANYVTLGGFGIGLVAAAMIAVGQPWLALFPLLANRIADGLDGAVARAHGKTDLGGYFDIVADFAFYGLIPFAFAIGQPTNTLAAAFLLLSFYINGASFLAYAVLAEKKGLQTEQRGDKSLYFTAGIMEGAETIGFFCVMCLFPMHFALLAWVFGALCFLTAIARIVLAHRVFPPSA